MSLSIVGCGDLDEVSSPHEVFQMTFPGQDELLVWDLQAFGWQGRDDTACLLKFKVAQDDLKTLFGGHFKPITDDGSIARSNPKLPWWTPLAGPPEILMESSSFHSDNESGHCYYTYHIKSQTCYLSWSVVE